MIFPSLRRRDWAWLALGIVLIGLAWAGSLDRLSRDYVGESLLDAGVIYATARGINALVSALQGTELDMWLVTFSIGELLDPVNDVIERFSLVMTIAVSSLVIQQLLLVIVSHVSFSVALTALGLATLAAIFIGSGWGVRALARTFLLVAFLRFSLALVVVGNLWVDHLFLPDSTGPEHAVMRDFYADLDNVSDTVRGDGGNRGEVAGQFERLQARFDAFVDGTLALLGAMLLKSVILPLLFLYAVVALARRLFIGAASPVSPPG
jgi:hypothetical protein